MEGSYLPSGTYENIAVYIEKFTALQYTNDDK